MKKELHPTYYPKATVTCACGNKFIVGSIIETLEIEICSACHPFYTGHGKIVDKLGKVQKFRERLSKKQAQKPKKIRAAKKEESKESTQTTKKPKKSAAKKKKTE